MWLLAEQSGDEIMATIVLCGVLVGVAFASGIFMGVFLSREQAAKRGLGRWHPYTRDWQWAVPAKILDTDQANFEGWCEGKPVYYNKRKEEGFS